MVYVVIYLRVSTDEQALSGLGLAAQEDACRVHAARMGWIVAGVFVDEGLSGSLPLDRRPSLIDAIAALPSGGVLLVAKRDRLFRSDPFTAAIIERAIQQRGARVVSAAGEGTDDDEPTSVLMRRILDAFGEYERLLIRARTRAALRAKRRRGERSGQIPYGRRLAGDGRTLLVDEAEQTILGSIRSMRDDGASLRAIAAALNARQIPTKRGGPWAASTIQDLLRSADDAASSRPDHL